MAGSSESTPTDGSTEKAPSGKTSAKKTPTKTSSSRTSGAKKARTRTSSAEETSGTAKQSESRTRSEAPRASSRPRPRSLDVASRLAGELVQLTGKQVEGVIGLQRTDEGWAAQVEVLEVRRIPDTTDMLATYEVVTDAQGSVESYERVRRYVRGSGDERP